MILYLYTVNQLDCSQSSSLCRILCGKSADTKLILYLLSTYPQLNYNKATADHLLMPIWSPTDPQWVFSWSTPLPLLIRHQAFNNQLLILCLWTFELLLIHSLSSADPWPMLRQCNAVHTSLAYPRVDPLKVICSDGKRENLNHFLFTPKQMDKTKSGVNRCREISPCWIDRWTTAGKFHKQV